MSTRTVAILAGAAFALLLGLVTGSTPIGLIVVAIVGGVAGGVADHLQGRRDRRRGQS